ncbi:quinone oxidoreductase [Marihabitans asiaticum]|uniref:NADPH2:quinone reductase n=1 Tax=Marihabitans asiaticum TaxID=415218 RepID=A0A560WCX0_9MICO|nr:quinone oxidoreductase [Marihabitans asiaticum]TWD15531.1 NADPH2:quinone reductase [Marihabitans asiaticum]
MADITALVARSHGGGEVLALESRPEPTPGPGELAVEVAAVGVNFIDVYQREGVYPTEPPFVLGNEGAGVVRSVGEGVSGYAPGDRVAWAFTLGSAAEVALIPADQAVRVPDKVDLETAAAIMLQGLTAHFLTRSTHPVQDGTVALVHAAAGGVGRLLVQLITHHGGRVIATAGSQEKCRIATDLGAVETIDYTNLGSEELSSRVRAAAHRLGHDAGVDVVYDGVGRATFDASLASLRPRGLMVLFGGASGQVDPFDIQRLNSGGSLYLTRPSLGHHIATTEELHGRANDVLGWVADGTLTVHVGGRYPWSEAADAYADLEGRRTTGKLVLVP